MLVHHIRRLPDGLEEEVAALPDEIFAQVFDADFAAMVAEATAAARSGEANDFLGGASSVPAGKSPEEVEAEARADQRTREYCERVWQLPASERWSIDSVWYNEPALDARAAVDADPPPPALRSAMDGLREQCGADARYRASAQLILQYADNAAADPTNERFRTVKSSAKAFARLLAPYPAALACLEALGFVRQGGAPVAAASPVCDGDVCTLPPAPDAGGGAEAAGSKYVLSDQAVLQLPRLAAHLRCELRAAELRGLWPAKLHPVLPDACRLLDPGLLQKLSDEVCTRHFLLLLDHTDNLPRVESAIRAGPPVVEMLISQLVEIRQNLTAAAAGAAPAGAVASRVRDIGSPEEWYDLLMDGEAGLIVADFGAPWCGPCHAVKPLFAQLSLKPEFSSVTFCYLDSEVLPQIMGDNAIESFPTFKFFRDTEEEDLPVIGGDIDAVEARIKRLLGS